MSIADELAAKTFRELNASQKIQTNSRISRAPNGYIFLISWSNAHLLRLLIRFFSDSLPKNEYRLKNQINDAARSVIANIEEGFARPGTKEYLSFLGFSEASLVEVKGDIQRACQDGFIKSRIHSKLSDLGIDLASWHNLLKQTIISRQYKGNYRNLKENTTNPLNSLKILYLPLKNLDVNNLTYEIFIELINKTGWNLRKLVESLEVKLNRDHKYYEVEKLRIRGKIPWRR